MTEEQDVIRELLLLAGDITVLRTELDELEARAKKILEKLDET